MPHKDPIKRKEYDTKRHEENRQNAYDSIIAGEIINKNNWDMWCNQIKTNARRSNYPYSDDFTNDLVFEMMARGCFYCGDVATTIDRVDSKLNHILENCIGCCKGCNNSKGAASSATFIRKAYYRASGEYADDITDIWFVNDSKPSMSVYKKSAEKKKVSFELTREDCTILIKGDCTYCQRSPDTWFGIDRIIPEDGYVIGNVVTCCFDCNIDKHMTDIKTTMARNKRIFDRVIAGELVIDNQQQTNLSLGANNRSRKVCVYGNVYESQRKASKAMGKHDTYIFLCIKNDTTPNDIF